MQKVLEDNDEKEEIQNAEDEVEFHQIDLLKDHGINQSDVQKLIDSGFMSIEAVFYTTKKNLCLIKGLSELKVDKILNICNEILSTGFQPSNIFLEKRKKLVRITTGSKELDTLLGGSQKYSGNFVQAKHKYAIHYVSLANYQKKMEAVQVKLYI